MASSKPLPVPGPEYNGEEERLFREGMSSRLLELEVALEDSQKNESIAAALAANVPFGQSEVGLTLEPAYASFSKGWGTSDAVTHTGLNLSAINWFSPPTTWTRNTYKDWEEVGPGTGTFKYTGGFPGSGSRNFLVNWSINLYYYSASYMGLAGRIRKTPSGGSPAEVAGSSQTTSWDHYLLYLGSYFYMKSLSNSAIVSLADGDTIQFEYGGNSVSGSGTTSFVAYRTYESGMNVTITSVD